MILPFDKLCVLSILIICLLHRSNNSLLSRFKNTNQYVAREQDYEDLLPDELDEEMTRHLNHEVPELRIFANNRSLQRVVRPPPYHPFDYLPENRREFNSSNFTTVYPRRMPFLTRWPTNNKTLDGRRFFDLFTSIFDYFNAWKQGKYIGSCYFCGIESPRLPTSPLCNDALSSNNWRYRTLARFLRVSCFNNQKISGFITYKKYVYGRYYWENDIGIKREYHSQWIIAGCMKRFLDLGTTYVVRGCRTWTPAWSMQYADHRWRRLEHLLRSEKDGCIYNPHASLTPFARGISLYARYHVCVCSKKYCNRSALASAPSLPLLLSLFLIYFINII